MLKYDPSLGTYFDDLKQGIMILSNLVNMPAKLVNRLLDIRCREMDSIVAHVELLPIYDSPVSTSASFLSSFLIDVSNTLARITFSQNLDVGVSNEDLSFLSTLSRYSKIL
jgi:hypothetical protein